MASELTPQDLDAEELNVTSAVLMAGAQHYGTYCKEKNDAFMKCRMELNDPRKCLTEGKEVWSLFVACMYHIIYSLSKHIEVHQSFLFV